MASANIFLVGMMGAGKTTLGRALAQRLSREFLDTDRVLVERTGVALLEGYGSTETNFVIASTPGRSRPGCMGWLRPGFEAKVVDAFDAELPAGEAGELVLREARTGRVEITQMWGRTESVREEFKRRRAQ